MASTDQSKFCPKCGASRVGDAWICACGFEFGAGPERSKRRRRHRQTVYETEPAEAERRVHRGRSRRRGPLFATIWFALLSLHWMALMALVYFLRFYHRRPLNAGDLFVGSIGCMLALFYLWVAYAVYGRRRYIWDIAMVCAGIWLIAIPTGTILALLIFGNLLSAKSEFTL